MIETHPWPGATLEGRRELRASHVGQLARGELSHVRVPLFCGVGECAAISLRLRSVSRGQRVSGLAFRTRYAYENATVDRFGPALVEYCSGVVLDAGKNAFRRKLGRLLRRPTASARLAARRARYFTDARAARQTRDALLEGLTDPASRVLELLRAAWPAGAEPAAAPDGSEYFVGLTREIVSAPVHRDWAPISAKGWEVGEIEFQLSWNVYLEAPAEGGDLYIFKREWREPDDSRYGLGAGRVGQDPEVIYGVPATRVHPEVGDLVLFNPKHYHAVGASQGGARLSMTSFVGLSHGRPLILWS